MFSSSTFSGSILSSQDDPPTLKNRAPASAAARFLKNRRLRSEGGLQSVLGLSWASFGRSWGSLGGLLGSSGVLLGVSWGLLGTESLTKLPFWLLWGALGCSWGSLGGLLGSSGVLWGIFWGLLSSLGVVLGALGSLLGAIMTLFRTILNSTTGFSELGFFIF